MQDCQAASNNLSYLGIIGSVRAQFVLLKPFYSKKIQTKLEYIVAEVRADDLIMILLWIFSYWLPLNSHEVNLN